MALARGSAGPSSTALGGHTVRGTQEGSGPELSGAAVGSLGWVRPSWLRARVFLAWTLGSPPPPCRVRWPLGPSTLHPAAAWHPKSVLTLGPSSPQPGLALIQLSPLHTTGLPRLSRPRGQRKGEPLARHAPVQEGS